MQRLSNIVRVNDHGVIMALNRLILFQERNAYCTAPQLAHYKKVLYTCQNNNFRIDEVEMKRLNTVANACTMSYVANTGVIISLIACNYLNIYTATFNLIAIFYGISGLLAIGSSVCYFRLQRRQRILKVIRESINLDEIEFKSLE